ncbi:ATP-binding protein [Natronorubrum daqingense]|uniref:histidine kinase n=1 Tax=Natronorubrum daqingense TaxID=588898 RepID=A0A1N6Z060_9EURY|nr:ATP-binding protein [Natronorubrum daqingense]APX95506.1 histidine kinase [Natronorubrum daqingense]SIR20159.1 His Kinase A (phospho-acceptor) domain-containing protein [Natronorubrum daqingense]
MDRWKRVLSSIGPRTVVIGLGAFYIVFSLVWGSVRVQGGTPAGNVVVVSSLIGLLGVALVYGGLALSRSDIRPEFYPDVAGWTLVGFGAMLGMLVVYNSQPADSISNPARAILFLTSFSSLAGFGVGIYDARAKTRATELEETVAKLEASNERLEQFAYAASHDLQEPLRMVSSYLQLIERRSADELSAETEEFLTFAVDGADRMRRMIESLLEYSRVETQGEPLSRVELDRVLEGVLDDLHGPLSESDVEVTMDSLPAVTGDERQLRQVFENLLTNAIEYGGTGPTTVHVSATRDGPWWNVTVEDDGIGIAPDDQERIFDVFQRLHSREDHPGVGIGLALCERIVERHEGRISVESELSEGSTFSVTLPVIDTER